VRTVPVPGWVRCELERWLNAAAIDRGKLFRRVNKAGETWGDGMTEKSVWHIVKESAKAIGLDNTGSSRSPALASATLPAENWNRSNFFWDMSQFKPPNAILAANSEFNPR